MIIRKFEDKDLSAMIAIWNEIVEEGIAFPQEEPLTSETGKAFFESQSYTGVADDDGKIISTRWMRTVEKESHHHHYIHQQ